MGTERGLVAAPEAAGVLELGADAQRGAGEAAPDPHRPRHPAARAAQHQRPPRHHPGHRVVAARGDGPVVDQEQVGDPAESRASASPSSKAMGSSERLPLVITSGRPASAQQQVVERRVGEHAGRAAGCPGPARRPAPRPGAGGRGRWGAPPSRAGSAPPASSTATAAAASRSATITASGFSSRRFRRRSSRHRGRGGGVAGEVEAAQPLHGQQPPLRAAPPPPPPADRPASGAPPGVEQREARPAGRAGVGLGVEAPVARVVVLGRAGVAHGEAGHGGGGPVVGDAQRDGEARAAVGAVGEGVAVAAVGRVGELGRAGRAGGQVGADGDARRAAGRRWGRSRRWPAAGRGGR